MSKPLKQLLKKCCLLALILCGPVFSLSGCIQGGRAALTFEPSATPLPPTPTLTPTATPVWFPPTATPTPLSLPTRQATPTVEMRPPLGEPLFEDDFTVGSEWSLGRSSTGSISLGQQELTLAVSQPEGYLYSLRKTPALKNFYLEITASPSICRGEDEYGLLLRVSPWLEFYRLALTCDGQARVDKVYNGRISSPQRLQYNGAVPPGAPSSSRLAVSMIGRELRFFANGETLFTVSDRSLTEGVMGVFARAGGEDVVTVNFSDLVVYAVSD